ncbi:MAG: methionine ABC transporter substrate-binding protein [Treponema sp.]|nr:methionine ABC transporter substrate-binding protein [Treponema sp.]
MKKTFVAVLGIALAVLALSSCSKKNKKVADCCKDGNADCCKEEKADCCKEGGEDGVVVLKGIIDLVPHQEIIDYAAPALLKEGIKVVTLQDASDNLGNEKTFAGEADFNYFQHKPYLDSVNLQNGWDLVSVAAIHVEPISLYSDKYTSLAEVPEKAVIAVPDDGTNEYRGLKLLNDKGFIRLSENSLSALDANVGDITEYLKPVKIVEINAFQIIPTRADYDLFVNNTNKILESGIKTNILAQEAADSPYGNIIVTKASRANDPAIQKLVKVLLSDDVQNWIRNKYNGAVIPVK